MIEVYRIPVPASHRAGHVRLDPLGKRPILPKWPATPQKPRIAVSSVSP